MALPLGARRDALIEAGATPTKADRAAGELAGYDSRLSAPAQRHLTLAVTVSVAMAASFLIGCTDE